MTGLAGNKREGIDEGKNVSSLILQVCEVIETVLSRFRRRRGGDRRINTWNALMSREDSILQRRIERLRGTVEMCGIRKLRMGMEEK